MSRTRVDRGSKCQRLMLSLSARELRPCFASLQSVHAGAAKSFRVKIYWISMSNCFCLTNMHTLGDQRTTPRPQALAERFASAPSSRSLLRSHYRGSAQPLLTVQRVRCGNFKAMQAASPPVEQTVKGKTGRPKRESGRSARTVGRSLIGVCINLVADDFPSTKATLRNLWAAVLNDQQHNTRKNVVPQHCALKPCAPHPCASPHCAPQNTGNPLEVHVVLRPIASSCFKLYYWGTSVHSTQKRTRR